jgi:hypothetical protein
MPVERASPPKCVVGLGPNDQCQFAPELAGPFFSFEGKTYCFLHAPMEAQMLGGSGLPVDVASEELPEFPLPRPIGDIPKSITDDDLVDGAILRKPYSQEQVERIVRGCPRGARARKYSNLPNSKGAFALAHPGDFQARLSKYASTMAAKYPKGEYIPPGMPDTSQRLQRMFNALINITRIGLTNFRGIVAPERLDFSDVEFLDLDFSESVFCGGVHFYNCVFRSRSTFKFSRFWDSAYFYESTFEGAAEFDYCCFNDQLNFHGSNFLNSLDLPRIEARQDVHLCCDLRSSYEADGSGRRGIPTIPNLDLQEGQFFEEVCFRNRTLIRCKISKAVFKQAPIFLRCTPPDDMEFSSGSFEEVTPSSVPKYATLLKLATSIGDWRGADIFRIRYFQSQQIDDDVPLIGRLVLAIYGWSSRYGTDYTRVGIIFLCENLLAFFSYCGISLMVSSLSVDTIVDAGRFTLRQVFKPFDVLGMPALGQISLFEQPPFYLVGLGVVQSVCALSLIGIFLHTWYRAFFNKY